MQKGVNPSTAPVGGPTVATQTIRAHLQALENYFRKADREQEYLAVSRMVGELLESFEGRTRAPAEPIGRNLDLISAWLGEPLLGLKLGPFSSRCHPRLDFFFRQSHVTLRDYCHMLKRYLGITTEVFHLTVTESIESVRIDFATNPDVYVSRHQVEGGIASVCEAVRDCYGVTASRVALSEDKAAGDIDTYRSALGCWPDFSVDTSFVEFPCRTQRRPAESGGPVSEEAFREIQKLEALDRQEGEDQSWSERCRFLLGLLMSYGEPLKTSVADILAITPRTLQRRLADEETSFRDILNEVRQAKALGYLRDTDLSLEDITFLLGFKDTGVFYRAFKGWTGKTPRDFRTAAQSAADG